ncbi:MAG: hypothetical protein ACTHN5_23805 [Phycisphaerae bacterium]
MAEDAEQSAGGEEGTGLPLLSTWRRVYGFVLISFAVMVVLLVWLTRAYS